MPCSCKYCLCLEHRISFSTWVPVQSQSPITANQQRTLLTRILSPSSIWKTSTHLPWMRFESTIWSTISLTTRAPPLLAKLKALNFRQWNQSGFSDHLKIISSYRHFQIPCVYTTFLACSATDQQLSRWKSMKKSWSHLFCQHWVDSLMIIALTDCLDSLMIIALQKYILKNFHSLYWENGRQISL